MATKIIPDSVRKVVDYNPDTGEISGRKASKDASGYMVVSIANTRYYVHRLAWFLVRDEQPDVIDHINRNPSDNRFCNLRNVTQKENTTNRTGVAYVKWGRAPSETHWRLRGYANARRVYHGPNHTIAWFKVIMAQRSTHPIGLPSP